MPPSDRETPHYEYLVVNDLTENERYSQLPFVANEPNFCFYAGTPLTTDNNINLGCFFVLDKSPRNGLTSLEKDTLGSLSTLVMDYMKVCRQASEGQRAARLSKGLSFFVEGSSSFIDSVDPSRTDSCPPHSVTPASTNNRISMSGGSRGSHHSDPASHEVSHSPLNDRSLSSDARSTSSGVSGASFSKENTGTSGAASSLRNGSPAVAAIDSRLTIRMVTHGVSVAQQISFAKVLLWTTMVALSSTRQPITRLWMPMVEATVLVAIPVVLQRFCPCQPTKIRFPLEPDLSSHLQQPIWIARS